MISESDLQDTAAGVGRAVKESVAAIWGARNVGTILVLCDFTSPTIRVVCGTDVGRENIVAALGVVMRQLADGVGIVAIVPGPIEGRS